MELNLDVPQGVLPSMPTNKKPEIASYSDMRIQGIDKVVHNTVDIFGYNVKEKDLYKFIGQGSKQIFSILKGWLGNPNELDKHYGANGQVPAVRILTPDKVYVIIADDTHNLPNVSKIRKVFNSGAKITLSPQIRNLIGCSGTMPEKLQGSFPSTRSLYKRNVRRHKIPLPHKAA